jgi:3-deoxy-manno-octulosonate cytidylyltransferase (CMP-KDO synthetase)
VPNAIGIIPSRYQSKRFPGKPLAPIAGVPLIIRVMQTAQSSRRLSRVYVACDDQRIADVVRNYGGQAIITKKEHATGSDRVAEAASGLDADYVINIQGDEPFLAGDVIDSVVNVLDDPNVLMSSACSPFSDLIEAENPNAVKVVLDKTGLALYFSRSKIPFSRDGDPKGSVLYRHIGIYGFKRDFLFKFASMDRTPLESTENLEQLRALENGYKIKMAIVKSEFLGIDSEADLFKAEELLSKKGMRYG